jgi:phosphoglycerate dehydrogenase-like enzyme
MSAAASWSYTSTATHWPRLTLDDWTRVATFGPPVSFACDYKAEARKAVDDRGEEFVTRQVLYTERSSIKRGDFVMIGVSTAVDPTLLEDAHEVRAVTRFADTFDKVADDYTVMT